MPYLNLDDDFPEHPKVDRLSDGAFRLHVSGIGYAAKHLTDGRVPEGKVGRLKPRFRPAQLRELLKVGVWHEGGSGCGTETCPTGAPGEYVIHDYLEWNRSADWWTERREAERKRKAAWRARREAS